MHTAATNHRIILPIAALQFIYLLNFIILLPLGPDVAQALAFPVEHLNWFSAAYTGASIVAGLLSIRVLDRFNRKHALLACFAGLVLSTYAAAQAHSAWALLAARALTGLFGSPTVALGMALIIDNTPPQQRGAAIGKVMLGFSAATLAGIPAALELAHYGNWRTAFHALAALALLTLLLNALLLPNTGKPQPTDTPTTLRTLLKQRNIRTACLVQASNQFATFLIVPVFSAVFVMNLGYPREQLSTLYLIGGLVAMLTMQATGKLNDRFGALPPTLIATACFALGLAPFLGFNNLPLVLVFVLFMASNASRNVSLMSLTSHIPKPQERASYMALQQIAQNIAIALAALVAAGILRSNTDGYLMETTPLALLAIATATLTLVGVKRLEEGIERTV